MANMAYCRFENTLGNLRDCYDALAELSNPECDLSDAEYKAFLRLVKLCSKIVRDYGDDE